MKKIDYKKIIYEIIAIVVAVIIAHLPLAKGLTQPGLTALAILAWAVLNWIFNIIPDYVVVLFMCSFFVVFKVTDFEVAFSAFSETTFWLILASLGLSAAVLKSGLLTRVSLYIMKIMPLNFVGQSLAMFLISIIVGPLIPSTVSKATLISPMTVSIGEKLGYEKKSKGMFGLWISMYYPITHIAPLFISGSFLGYMTLSFLPQEIQDQFSYLNWLKAMIVWGIVMYVLGFLVINFLYNPKTKVTINHDDIDDMLNDIGKITRDEKIVIGVMITCLVFWVLERVIGISSSITAIIGLATLISLGVLDKKDIGTKINWTFLIFVGGAIGLGSVFADVKLNIWIGEVFTPIVSGLASNKVLLILTLAILTVLVRIIEASATATVVILNVISLPLCVSAGINPFIGAVSILMFCKQYFFKFQSPETMSSYIAADGDETLGWKFVSQFNGLAIILGIIALLATMPYWHLIGLM